MAPVLYVRRWSRQTRRPFPGHGWIDPEQARQIYDTGLESLEVLDATHTDADGLPRPRWRLGFAENGFVRVTFATAAGTIWRCCDYEPRDGRLFLAHVYEYTYPEGQGLYFENQCTLLTRFYFHPDGRGAVEIRDKSTPGTDVGRFTGADVSSLWGDRPQFGRWSDLADAGPRWSLPGR